MNSLIGRKKSGTCICVIKDRRGGLWVAADRRASWDFSRAQSMPRPKLSKKNGVILAGTGDGFLCHLIVDILDVPEIETEPDNYVHGIFYDRVKKLLERKGMVDKDKMLKIPGDCAAEIILVVSNHCYIVDIFNPESESVYHNGLITIDEVSLPYTAGCGGEHAKGCIDAMKLQGINDCKVILKTAIQVAAMNSPGCDNICDIEHE